MPHWEHGYRTHGYWASASERLGAVGLGPRGRWDGVYRWSVDRTGEAGEATTLRQAKREVEQRTGGANTSEKREVAMKPYSPQSNKGRTVSGDDVHHKTADQSKQAANAAAKSLRKAARQEGARQARGE